jgi:hypothetical protein
MEYDKKNICEFRDRRCSKMSHRPQERETAPLPHPPTFSLTGQKILSTSAGLLKRTPKFVTETWALLVIERNRILCLG